MLKKTPKQIDATREMFKAGVGDEPTEYFTTRINEVTPIYTTRTASSGASKNNIKAIVVNGRKFETGTRFLNSLCSRFEISPTVFNLFDPVMSFEKLGGHPNSNIRITTRDGAALAISSPSKPIITCDGVLGVLENAERNPENIKYNDGVVSSTHGIQSEAIKIGSDDFRLTFRLDVPIDGYGSPSIYLSVLRLLCLNGVVAYTPIFRSQVSLGKRGDNPEIPLTRAIDSFNNEEGFAAITQRMNASRTVPPSVREVLNLRRAIIRALRVGERTNGIADALDKITGTVSDLWHVADANGISPKQQRFTHMNGSIYDLFCFVTELNTHYGGVVSNPGVLDGWVGNTLGSEFDLEGVRETNGAHKDFYLT